MNGVAVDKKEHVAELADIVGDLFAMELEAFTSATKISGWYRCGKCESVLYPSDYDNAGQLFKMMLVHVWSECECTTTDSSVAESDDDLILVTDRMIKLHEDCEYWQAVTLRSMLDSPTWN